jgi:hypothetical protein
MTEQERATMCDMLEMRRQYLLQRASIVRSEQTAKAWREFADRDAVRIARLRTELAEAKLNE